MPSTHVARGLDGYRVWLAVAARPNRDAASLTSERAQALAAQHTDCVAAVEWRSCVARSDVDLVIVSTTNDMLAPIALAADHHVACYLYDGLGG